MPKRNTEEKIVYYKNKLRKLEEKTHNRIRCLSSSDSEQNPSPTATEDRETMNANLDFDELATAPEVAPELSCIDNETAATTTPSLDPEVLAALGEITDEAPEFGEKIQKNIAKIWLPLLKKGMTKDIREILLKNYPIPENCPLLQAPTLNPEISAAISESGRFRDKKMTATQQQLGVGITAISRGLHMLVNNEKRVDAIRFISDGCRILSDLHRQNTETRIKFIIPGLDKSFLQVLNSSERDNTLFGNDLSEKIRASKAIVKQGEQIKKTLPISKPSSSSSRVQTIPNRPGYQGNWSGPSCFQSNSGGGRGGQKRISQRAPSASNHSKNSLKPRAPTRHP